MLQQAYKLCRVNQVMLRILPRMRCYGLEAKLHALLELCISKGVYYNPSEQLYQTFELTKVRTLNKFLKYGNQVKRKNGLAVTEVK